MVEQHRGDHGRSDFLALLVDEAVVAADGVAGEVLHRAGTVEDADDVHLVLVKRRTFVGMIVGQFGQLPLARQDLVRPLLDLLRRRRHDGKGGRGRQDGAQGKTQSAKLFHGSISPFGSFL